MYFTINQLFTPPFLTNKENSITWNDFKVDIQTARLARQKGENNDDKQKKEELKKHEKILHLEMWQLRAISSGMQTWWQSRGLTQGQLK